MSDIVKQMVSNALWGGSSGGGLPTGGEPHQMLVTDKTGKAGWEDKLCWAESETVTVLPETVMEYAEEGKYMGFTPVEREIVIGNTYTVQYNGTDYECKALAVEEITAGTVAFGNVGAMIEGYPATDDPFIILLTQHGMEPEEDGAVLDVVVPFEAVDSVTVSVHATTKTIKPIDPENLAPGVAANRMLVTNAEGKAEWQERLAWKSGGTEYLLKDYIPMPYQNNMMAITDIAIMAIEEGKTYTVTIGGLDFECEAIGGLIVFGYPAVVLGNAAAWGGTGGGSYPFGIAVPQAPPEISGGLYGFLMLMIPPTGGVALSIQHSTEVIKQIPKEFIPTQDWAAEEGKPGFIKNRTHTWQQSIVEILNSTISATGPETVPAGTAYNCQWRRPDVAMPDIEKTSIGDKLYVTIDGTEYTMEAVKSLTGGTVAFGNMALNPGATEAEDTNEPACFEIATLGTDVMLMGFFRIEGEHTVIIKKDGLVPGKQLDPGFIPDNSCYLTSPNGTRYKLTVSDDGTLTATAL